MKTAVWSIIIPAIFLSGVYAEKKIVINEDFSSLSSWKELKFPKIKRYSRYTILKSEGGILKAESDRSASGIIYKHKFNVYKYHAAKWRWKIKSVYKRGNAKSKSGDDYPIRIYIIFKYNPEKASFFERAKYNAAKLIYGEYPPHSTINFVWASRNHSERMITSPYTGRAKMIFLQKGNKNAGKWINEKVNILKEYKKAFGKMPPAIAGIAVMNDSDNTKEKAVSYLDYIEVYGE